MAPQEPPLDLPLMNILRMLRSFIILQLLLFVLLKLLAQEVIQLRPYQFLQPCVKCLCLMLSPTCTFWLYSMPFKMLSCALGTLFNSPLTLTKPQLFFGVHQTQAIAV